MTWAGHESRVVPYFLSQAIGVGSTMRIDANVWSRNEVLFHTQFHRLASARPSTNSSPPRKWLFSFRAAHPNESGKKSFPYVQSCVTRSFAWC
jgi:hypothetical protein